MTTPDYKAKTPGKAVTISARISQDDSLFLAQYQVAGAVTPSDKLRAIITEARERQQRLQDYRGSMVMFQDLLAPVATELRARELEHQIHSELITRILEWLPDMLAYVIAAHGKLAKMSDTAPFEQIEAGISDRIFRLIESVLQMGVTRWCPCYNPDAISSRIEPVLDLAQVIQSMKQQGERT